MVASAVVAALTFLQNFQVLVVFQDKAGGLPQRLGCQLPDAQGIQGRGPVQSLGDGGFFQNGIVGSEAVGGHGDLGA